MDHCDLMKEEMTVHLDRLTARFDCLANVTVVLGNDTTKVGSRHWWKIENSDFQQPHSARHEMQTNWSFSQDTSLFS